MTASAPQKSPAAAAPPPIRRGFGRRIALTGVALGLLVATAEVAVRVDDLVRRDVPFFAAPDFQRDLTIVDSLGPRGRPNGHFQKWKLNSAGFRSDEAALTPQPGCTRVMALGASETFGAGESPGKEYPAQLRDSLNTHGCFQVISAAIPGLSLRGVIKLWNDWASQFRPDFVVVLINPTPYLGNNAPVYPPRVTTPPAPIPAFELYPRLVIRAKEMIEVPDFIQRRRIQQQLDALTNGKPADWFFESVPDDRLAQFRQDLDSLIVSIRAHGATPVLTTHPHRFSTQMDGNDRAMMNAWRSYTPRATAQTLLAFEDSAAAVVREAAARDTLPMVELARNMNGHSDWFWDFTHFTDAGAAEVAERVTTVVVTAKAAR